MSIELIRLPEVDGRKEVYEVRNEDRTGEVVSPLDGRWYLRRDPAPMTGVWRWMDDRVYEGLLSEALYELQIKEVAANEFDNLN